MPAEGTARQEKLGWAVCPAVVPGAVTAQPSHMFRCQQGREKKTQERKENGSVSPCSFVAQLSSW